MERLSNYPPGVTGLEPQIAGIRSRKRPRKGDPIIRYEMGSGGDPHRADRVTETGNKQPLPLRLDLFNHSPTGFSWGYEGSGPAQLALAILADVVGPSYAVDLHQAFKRDVVARQSMGEPWAIRWSEVARWVNDHLDPEL